MDNSKGSSKVTLVTVGIDTKLGAHYEFPDVDSRELRKVLPESGRMPEGQPTLSLINASMSILSVLFRIIKRITVDGKEVWRTSDYTV